LLHLTASILLSLRPVFGEVTAITSEVGADLQLKLKAHDTASSQATATSLYHIWLTKKNKQKYAHDPTSIH